MSPTSYGKREDSGVRNWVGCALESGKGEVFFTEDFFCGFVFEHGTCLYGFWPAKNKFTISVHILVENPLMVLPPMY